MSATQSSTPTPRLKTPRPKTPSRFHPDCPLMAGGLDWSWAFVVYRPAPGYPDYLLGSDGTVWSRKRVGTATTNAYWTQLFPTKLGRYGHLTVSFARNKKATRKTVHRLVLQAFVGPCPPGKECCHNDGDASNNRIENLRWDTRQSNADDRKIHGSQRFGEAHHNAKLTWAKVTEIRRLRALRVPQTAIAAQFGVSHTIIAMIDRNERWVV